MGNELGNLEGRFRNVQPGMDEARVVAVPGEPDYEGYSFQLGQEGGFEDAYKRALHSGSDRWGLESAVESIE